MSNGVIHILRIFIVSAFVSFSSSVVRGTTITSNDNFFEEEEEEEDMLDIEGSDSITSFSTLEKKDTPNIISDNIAIVVRVVDDNYTLISDSDDDLLLNFNEFNFTNENKVLSIRKREEGAEEEDTFEFDTEFNNSIPLLNLGEDEIGIEGNGFTVLKKRDTFDINNNSIHFLSYDAPLMLDLDGNPLFADNNLSPNTNISLFNGFDKLSPKIITIDPNSLETNESSFFGVLNRSNGVLSIRKRKEGEFAEKDNNEQEIMTDPESAGLNLDLNHIIFNIHYNIIDDYNYNSHLITDMTTNRKFNNSILLHNLREDEIGIECNEFTVLKKKDTFDINNNSINFLSYGTPPILGLDDNPLFDINVDNNLLSDTDTHLYDGPAKSNSKVPINDECSSETNKGSFHSVLNDNEVLSTREEEEEDNNDNE